MNHRQYLDDILLGMRIAFEGYRISRLSEDIKVGMRLAWETYPRWIRGDSKEKVLLLPVSPLGDAKKRLRRIVPKREKYHVSFPDGRKVAFDDLLAATRYVNTRLVSGKCWIEDRDESTIESVLFVGEHRADDDVLHSSPWGRELVGRRVRSECGRIGRLAVYTRDRFFQRNRYCAECFPSEGDIMRYVAARSLQRGG